MARPMRYRARSRPVGSRVAVRVRIPSDVRGYRRPTMLFAVFVSLYAACAALLLAVIWQDHRRGQERRGAPDPRATHATEFVFRTHA